MSAELAKFLKGNGTDRSKKAHSTKDKHPTLQRLKSMRKEVRKVRRSQTKSIKNFMQELVPSKANREGFLVFKNELNNGKKIKRIDKLSKQKLLPLEYRL